MAADKDAPYDEYDARIHKANLCNFGILPLTFKDSTDYDRIDVSMKVVLTKKTGGVAMYDKKELCEKITAIYPEIGVCGIDIDVSYDKEKKSWVVDLTKGENNLKHYLEVPDADTCMDGKQCVSLGLEIAQLKKNIEGKQF